MRRGEEPPASRAGDGARRAAAGLTFGSASLAWHLARGAVGVVALLAALRGYEVVGWPALSLLGVTLWSFRGCPMCWTMGLIETVAFKVMRARENAG